MKSAPAMYILIAAAVFLAPGFSSTDEKETAAKETGKMKIAVLDFESETGADKKDLLTLTGTLRGELTGVGLFEVIHTKDMNKILDRSGINTEDLTSDDDAARKRLGKLLNAKLAVTCMVNSAFKNISMNIRLIDLETGEILMEETPSCSEDSVFKEVHEIALDITDKFSNVSTAENNRQQKPGTSIVPNNMIAAGDFPDGSVSYSETPGNWCLGIMSPAGGHYDVSGNICTVVTERRGNNPWEVQLYYVPVKLEYGLRYKFSFDVKSGDDRKFFVMIQKNSPPWTQYFHEKHFDATTEWQTISYDFKSQGTDDYAKFVIECGSDKPSLYFRNISLTKFNGEE